LEPRAKHHKARDAFASLELSAKTARALVGFSDRSSERQTHSQLFARLLKSRNKAGVMDLASRGQVLDRPIDALASSGPAKQNRQ
jgi:hypothetical protein